MGEDLNPESENRLDALVGEIGLKCSMNLSISVDAHQAGRKAEYEQQRPLDTTETASLLRQG